MKTAAEYRKHAEECRTLAQQMPKGEQRDQLMKMARTWKDLAEDRERVIRNHPEANAATPPNKGHVPAK